MTPIRVSADSVTRRLLRWWRSRRRTVSSSSCGIAIAGSAAQAATVTAAAATVDDDDCEPPAPQLAHRGRQRVADDERQAGSGVDRGGGAAGMGGGHQPGADRRDHRPHQPVRERAQHPARRPAPRSSGASAEISWDAVKHTNVISSVRRRGQCAVSRTSGTVVTRSDQGVTRQQCADQRLADIEGRPRSQAMRRPARSRR